MTTTVVEELPLFRAKCEAIGNTTAAGPGVGPATYNVTDNRGAIGNNSRAPFNSTSLREGIVNGDPRVPGPGKYDLTEPVDERIGVVSCPFVSEVPRFPFDNVADVPGPGSYNTQGKWPHKPAVRSHKFTELAPGALANTLQDPSIGPGYYYPNHHAASRANPKAAHFAKYSSRTAEVPNSNPGPGSYNLDAKPRTLYANKPSSMFATNTKRNQYNTKDTPGPGDYDIGAPMGRRSYAAPNGRTAFGTSASRFMDNKKDELPGPGWYTGEIAPRRPVYDGRMNTFPFAATADRFYAEPSDALGPGVYDANKPPKHLSFGGATPFGSTVARFGPVPKQFPDVTIDEVFLPGRRHQVPGQRRGPLRAFETGDIKPSSMPKPFGERSYNVKYDWPKPTSTRNTLPNAPRDFAAKDNGVPGPGTYHADGSLGGHGQSNWGKSVRFNPAGTERGGVIGPGRYHHESTFLKKSFNCTIGSDITW